MLVSTKGRYALRIMLELAQEEKGSYLSLPAIAKRQDISEKYLESIVSVLVKAGLVEGMRGKGGGYRLSRPLKDYSVGEILRLTEGSLAPVSCLETAVERGGEELVTAYFQCLLRLALEEAPFLAPGDERLAPALECIHRRFGEKLTLETLAALTHLEKNHFIRVFRRAMGITPYQYLRQVRLNRAASLLRRGQSVSGAAAACGFESAAALSHAMRKSRNVSPEEIRGIK